MAKEDAVDEDVADGLLIDVRDVDLASLLTESAAPGMNTALDRLLMSDAAGCNGFDAII